MLTTVEKVLFENINEKITLNKKALEKIRPKRRAEGRGQRILFLVQPVYEKKIVFVYAE